MLSDCSLNDLLKDPLTILGQIFDAWISSIGNDLVWVSGLCFSCFSTFLMRSDCSLIEPLKDPLTILGHIFDDWISSTTRD